MLINPRSKTERKRHDNAALSTFPLLKRMGPGGVGRFKDLTKSLSEGNSPRRDPHHLDLTTRAPGRALPLLKNRTTDGAGQVRPLVRPCYQVCPSTRCRSHSVSKDEDITNLKPVSKNKPASEESFCRSSRLRESYPGINNITCRAESRVSLTKDKYRDLAGCRMWPGPKPGGPLAPLGSTPSEGKCQQVIGAQSSQWREICPLARATDLTCFRWGTSRPRG